MGKAEEQVAKAIAVPGHSSVARYVLLKRGMHRKPVICEICELFVFAQGCKNAETAISGHELEGRRPRLERKDARR